jgi:hypothetical protein
MSDYDGDQDRFRNRFNDDDFDSEGGYGRNMEGERGFSNRPYDPERGYYGRGSDFNRGGYGPAYGRYGQGRSPYNRGMNQSGEYGRSEYPMSRYWRGSENDRGFNRNYNQPQGYSGRGMDTERGSFGEDYGPDFGYGQNYGQGYGRFGQGRSQSNRGMNPDWYYGRGSPSRGGYPRSGYGSGYGYNRDFYQPDWDRDFDFENDVPFEPIEFTYTEFWMIPGPESGHGPQGYQRTDERIYEDVCDRLMQHGRIDASDMTVSVSNHEVTLSGTVNSRSAKRTAEDLAEAVPGVTNVHNQLKVNQRERQGRERSEQSHQEAQMGQTGQTREVGEANPGPSRPLSENH